MLYAALCIGAAIGALCVYTATNGFRCVRITDVIKEYDIGCGSCAIKQWYVYYTSRRLWGKVRHGVVCRQDHRKGVSWLLSSGEYEGGLRHQAFQDSWRCMEKSTQAQENKARIEKDVSRHVKTLTKGL